MASRDPAERICCGEGNNIHDKLLILNVTRRIVDHRAVAGSHGGEARKGPLGPVRVAAVDVIWIHITKGLC